MKITNFREVFGEDIYFSDIIKYIRDLTDRNILYGWTSDYYNCVIVDGINLQRTLLGLKPIKADDLIIVLYVSSALVFHKDNFYDKVNQCKKIIKMSAFI